MSGPRVTPLVDAEMNEAQRDAVKPFVRPDGTVHNVFRTVGRHPDALRRWTPFVRHVLKSSLSQRETELLILRVAARRDSAYAWAQHVRIARSAGLTDREILAVGQAATAVTWTAAEAALLQAADDLIADACISEPTWRSLSAAFSEAQLIDVILTVGQYNTAAMLLKTCGVEIDEDFAADPPLDATR